MRWSNIKRAVIFALAIFVFADQTTAQDANSPSTANTEKSGKNPEKKEPSASSLMEDMRRMRETIERLEARVKQLEGEKSVAEAKSGDMQPAAADKSIVTALPASKGRTATLTEQDRGVLDFFRGTTVNLTLDGYYGYNFNRPVGGINLLRAYDVTSNSFSLNQATIVIERAPDVEAGRR